MSQRTKRRVADQVKSFTESTVLPFHEILDAKMVEDELSKEKVKFNNSVYTPLVTLCLFLSQVLDPDHSCRAAVARLIVWLTINGRKPCSSRGKLVSRGGNWCQFIFLDPLPGVGVG